LAGGLTGAVLLATTIAQTLATAINRSSRTWGHEQPTQSDRTPRRAGIRDPA
jgi:hypothetical protein